MDLHQERPPGSEARGSGHDVRGRVEVGTQCEEDTLVKRLEKEKEELKQRLEFVEELVGPTEAQRKSLQEQVLAARAAALKARYRGASVPTKVAGRLDERLMWASGLTERDTGLLQGGCLPDNEGILQDVSLLGDPNFRPYNQQTGEYRWDARGGVLQLSLGEVRNRFGDKVANDVVRCAKELDRYDASRRVGVELPWHPLEERELDPAEVIGLLDRELSLHPHLLYPDERDLAHIEGAHVNYISPYAVVNAPPRRGRGRPSRAARIPGGAAARSTRAPPRSGSAGVAPGSSAQGGAVVSLPRVETTRRAPEARCAPPAVLRPNRMQEALDHALAGCTDRFHLW
mmetsp:Transcript_31089/g.89140  ORF Transcript_31089/g.89140 Transcript_31089/m.89140 type:complete len:344 (+) Transcript_31089:113-1144(+)